MALRYKLGLQAPGAADTEQRKLHVTVNDQPEIVYDLPATAREATLDLQRDDAVSCYLVDVDSSGNVSQPSPILAFTAIDTVPPPPPAAPVVNEVTQTD